MTANPFRERNDDLKIQQKEYRLQCAVADQIPVWFPELRWLHVPNRPGSGTDGFHKKRMGAKAGASDLVCSWRAHGALHGGLLELKVDGGTLSNDQNRFLSSWASIGWHTGEARSCQQAFNALCRWGLTPASHAVSEPDYRTDNDKKADSFDYFAP